MRKMWQKRQDNRSMRIQLSGTGFCQQPVEAGNGFSSPASRREHNPTDSSTLACETKELAKPT